VRAEPVPGRDGQYHWRSTPPGVERPEDTGGYSREPTALVAREAPTDVFVLSHEGQTLSSRDPRNPGASSWKR
jgi:hypothetical protein